MRDVTLTIYRTAKDTKGRPTTLPWPRWVEVFGQHAERGSPEDEADEAALNKAKDGPAVVLGEIAEGKGHSAANVRSVHALSLDLEKLPDDRIVEVLGRLAPFEWVAHTTHKHHATAVGWQTRIRVVLPLGEPIGPSEHAQAWSNLNALVGGVNDPSTRDVSRLNYLPSTWPGGPRKAIHHPGKWITMRDLEPFGMAQEDGGRAAPRIVSSGSPEAAAVKVRRWLKAQWWATGKPAEWGEALRKGEALAARDSGKRHEAIVALTWEIARMDHKIPPGAIVDLFKPCIEAMRSVDPGSPGMEDVANAWVSAIEKVALAEQEEHERRTREAVEKVSGDARGQYTDAELEVIARRQNVSVEALRDRWIIARDGPIWILADDGEYKGPFSTMEDKGTMIVRLLARAPMVKVINITERGHSYVPPIDVIRQHGTVAERVVSDMTTPINYYDAHERTMHEVACRRRPILPRREEQVEQWLRLLCGEHYAKVVDWLSCCPKLDRLLCGIYFAGVPGAGKSLFAHGLASMYGYSPVPLKDALENFNEGLSHCPIILGDEKLPQKWGRNVTADLRELIGSTVRPLHRKFRHAVDMIGCVRVILGANNRFLLDSRDMNTRDDMDAMAQRVLHIKAPREAADFLEALPKAERERWKAEAIAAHCLWLAETHEVAEPGKRFWVDGGMSDMLRLLMTGAHWNSLVAEWLVRYLDEPSGIDTKKTGMVRRGDGELLVNEQVIIDNWELYIKSKRVEPDTRMVSQALKALSVRGASKRQVRGPKGQRIRMAAIDIENLIAWADDHNFSVDVAGAVGQRPMDDVPGSWGDDKPELDGTGDLFK